MNDALTRANMLDRLALFEERKGAIIAFAERIQALAKEGGDPGTAQVLDDFMTRFRSNRFLLLVVGDFKSGKSTLVNALVERAVCPVKATPRTAKVTRLSGTLQPEDAESVEITFQEDRPIERRPLESTVLDDLVAVNGAQLSQVQLVDVYLKTSARLLQHPVRLVDTPGLGSGDEEHSRVTRDYMQHADALVFVFSAVKPFSDSERDFLLSFRPLLDRTLLVVNQLDRVPEEERGDVLEHIRHSLERDVFEKGTSLPKLYPVSAFEAVTGFRKKNNEQVKNSGMPELVDAIEARLADEHSAKLLRSIADQQSQICSILSERAVLAADALESSSSVVEAMRPRFKELREELREIAKGRGAVEQALRSQESAWIQSAPDHASRIRGEIIDATAQWIVECPSEEICKKSLPAVLAKGLTERLERLDAELAKGYAKVGESAYSALNQVFGNMEARTRQVLTPEHRKDIGGGMGSGVAALSGLSAVAQRVGGPTGGYGVATAALAQALAPSSSVQLLSVTAAVSLLLAGFAGPVGWVIAGITSLVAAFLGFNRSSTWRERVLARIQEQVDQQIVPKVHEAIEDSVERFCSGVVQEVQERTSNVLSRLEAVVNQVAADLEREAQQRRREALRLRKYTRTVEGVRSELEQFRSTLPSVAASTATPKATSGEGPRGD
jgi:GTPase Era involved in 16S rRNA processing